MSALAAVNENGNGENQVLARSSDSEIADARNQSRRNLAFLPETTDADVASNPTSNKGKSSPKSNNGNSLSAQLSFYAFR